MEAPFSMNDLAYAENFLAQDDAQTALPLLLDLRDAAEAFIDTSCTPTEDTQYFSFGSTFERLAYRRVEGDPRTLVNVTVPFDRLYADLSFAYVRLNEHTLARDALMQAVRWNPMRCAYRLDLAELFRFLGDTKEWASLSHSVVERASNARDAARAYANLGLFFLDEENLAAASACARRACELDDTCRTATMLCERLDRDHPEHAEISDEQAFAELEQQGVPATPNAEIAVCMLMCATDAARAGNEQEATRLTIAARDLIGAEASRALIQLIRESDAELASEHREEERHAEA